MDGCQKYASFFDIELSLYDLLYKYGISMHKTQNYSVVNIFYLVLSKYCKYKFYLFFDCNDKCTYAVTEVCIFIFASIFRNTKAKWPLGLLVVFAKKMSLVLILHCNT